MSFDIVLSEQRSDSESLCAAVQGELCIFHASEIKPRLLDLIKPEASCDVDLSAVSEIDTAGVQLLLLLKREAAQADCQLNFINHSDALLEVMELFHLSRNFGDPVLLMAEANDEP
jgi:anti-sigma B factor antagonist